MVKVLFSCVGCARIFTIDYPKFGDQPVKYKPQHVVEFLAELMTIRCPACDQFNDISATHCANDFCPKYSKRGEAFPEDLKKNKLVVDKKWEKGSVTFHDPCHFIRHMCHEIKDEEIAKCVDEGDNNMWKTYVPNQFQRKRWIDMPRAIMRAIPGLEVKEMYRIGENSLCCGAGGGVKAGYPEFALNAAAERVEEAEASGADNIMTACPFCELNLGQAAREDFEGKPEGAAAGGKFKEKVFDLIEVVNELVD